MLIETIPKNNRKDMLYNDIVQLTQSLDIRLPADNFVGKLIKCLTNALWHIDGNHSKINSASLEGKWKSLPDLFSKIHSHQYTMWQEQKKQKPMLSQGKLALVSNELFNILSYWKSHFKLGESLHSYSKYLNKKREHLAESCF